MIHLVDSFGTKITVTFENADKDVERFSIREFVGKFPDVVFVAGATGQAEGKPIDSALGTISLPHK